MNSPQIKISKAESPRNQGRKKRKPLVILKHRNNDYAQDEVTMRMNAQKLTLIIDKAIKLGQKNNMIPPNLYKMTAGGSTAGPDEANQNNDDLEKIINVQKNNSEGRNKVRHLGAIP